jgi:alpha-L-rhamnosidase
MTHYEVFGNAKWISTQESRDAALFRSEFDSQNTESAKITICGLGYFELYINGRRVGDDYYVPANSNYHDRPNMTLVYPLHDKWSYRIYCVNYDITKYLVNGKNVIGVAVGGGFYHQLLRTGEGHVSYGDIKLCYRINLDGKEILSDENVKYNFGFFVKSNLYFGETLDYTGFDRKWNTTDAETSGWKECVAVPIPESNYCIQDCPTDKIAEKLNPELVKDFGDYSVYKVSKNISGFPVIRCDKAGEKVVFECAEELYEDMNIDNTSVGYGEQRQTATFITDGTNNLYHPYFCWFGFRYFSLTNNAEPVEVDVIHSDVKVTSSFECSDETLNWYYKSYINTQLCNMHGSVPSDCPHRERLGYTGDGQLCCDAAMTEFDAESFYRKWIDDIVDCQNRENGHVQHTAPFAGGGGGPAGWGGAMIVVPYVYYRHYGNLDLLKRVFPNMKLFVKYIESRCENGLIVREEKDGWCLGDWCTPEKIKIPEPFVNTTMFIKQLEMMSYCAEVLGENKKEYAELIKLHTEAVKEKYYDADKLSCMDCLQGADAFLMDCCEYDQKLIENLVEKYRKLGEFDTGIFGTYILLRVLFESGNGNEAIALLSNKKTVSFETMRKSGATTIWENWNAESSHSHPMFGASTQYLFEYVLGIRQNEKSVRYDEVTISPVISENLNFAKGFITTPHGEIGVEWKKNNGKINIEIEMCEDINAVFKYGSFTKKLSAGKNVISI